MPATRGVAIEVPDHEVYESFSTVERMFTPGAYTSALSGFENAARTSSPATTSVAPTPITNENAAGYIGRTTGAAPLLPAAATRVAAGYALSSACLTTSDSAFEPNDMLITDAPLRAA